jgi:hypothetical protein
MPTSAKELTIRPDITGITFRCCVACPLQFLGQWLRKKRRFTASTRRHSMQTITILIVGGSGGLTKDMVSISPIKHHPAAYKGCIKGTRLIANIPRKIPPSTVKKRPARKPLITSS